MKEAKRKRLFYAVFVAAVLWGLYMQPWKRRERRQPAPAPAAEASVTSATAAVVPQRATDWTARASVSEWTIDPFRPVAPEEAGASEEPQVIPNAPVLQGTMTVRGAEVCVIEGQICQTGDRAGSWTVVQIDKGAVTLVGPNQERVTLNTRDRQRK